MRAEREMLRVLTRALTEDSDHLDYETMEAWVDGTLLLPDRTRAEAHVKSCAACAAELAAIAKLAVPSSSRHYTYLAIAAALLLAVFAVILTKRQPVTIQPKVELVAREISIEVSPRVKLVQMPASSLLGPQSHQAFEPLAPVGTFVATPRPRFAWTALPHARNYRVEVFDAHFTRVADSGALHETEWTPPQDLPRGVVFSWQVTASTDKGEVRAPGHAAPEAKFGVIEEDIRAEEQRDRHDPLMLAQLYARHGLVADAREQLAIAEKSAKSPAERQRIEALRRALDAP